MDIASLSMNMASAQTGQAVGIALTKMSMEIVEQNSTQMIDMMENMEQSVTPHIGGTIDIKL